MSRQIRSRLVRSRVVRLAAASLVGFALAGCIKSEELQHGYVLDEQAVTQIRPGMGPEQVLKTLGSPSTVSTVGNKSWYYISQTSRRTVQFMGESESDRRVLAVYFTPGFKVERVALYGLQDGRVFDFISRRTPSGGSDQNFVGQLFRGLGTFIPNI
jgi:outer membrane protein assembly factor BamE (lipoprotein component of BamABCDE complex)